MHMRVKAKRARMRVQHRHRAGLPWSCLWFWLKVRSVSQAHSISLAFTVRWCCQASGRSSEGKVPGTELALEGGKNLLTSK